jgi:uncharacterized protein YbjT (DUF2867 family)
MSSMTPPSSPILVLGGTGKTGRRVARRLTVRGVPVRIGSRAASPAFDWDDRDTWAAALAGVRGVYVSFYPDLAVPGAADAVAALAAQAVAAGAERLVLLSGRGEDEAQRAEERVRAAAPDTTILRSTWFAQNFSESFMLEGLRTGELALPANGVPEPFVDVEDIADVAVAALSDPGHAGELYELTGPRLLTFAAAVAEIGAAAGREIAFVPVPVDAYAEALHAAGLPPVEVELITYLFGEVLDGRNARLADGVQRALGRPPRDFGAYARGAAAAGAWDA